MRYLLTPSLLCTTVQLPLPDHPFTVMYDSAANKQTDHPFTVMYDAAANKLPDHPFTVMYDAAANK